MLTMRVNPNRTAVAVLTNTNVTAGKWFIYRPEGRGYYSDGVRDGVENTDPEKGALWTEVTVPDVG